MKLEELKQKHQAELDAFYTERERNLADLWHAEKDIVEALDMEQDRIPESLRQRLDYDWTQFEMQWGVESQQFKSLVLRQQHELAQQRQDMIAAFRENGSDITDKPYLYENLEGRHKEWAELQHDHKAIEDYYKAEKRPIPKATQNRMKRHIEDYMQRYDLPYVPDESIHPQTEKELALYLDVHDIYEADYAIAQTYEIPPDSTNDRLRLDLHDYFTNYEAYHASRYENSVIGKLADKYQRWKDSKQSQANEKQQKNSRREQFKKRLQSDSEQSQNRGMDIE